MRDRLTQLGRRLDVFQQFIRFPAFGFSAMLPLLGAATVARQLSAQQVAGIVCVALAFHSFSYVLNDVIDLPVDRTQALRSDAPLVRGLIRPGPALIFALLQAPVALIVTAWLGGGSAAYVALSASFVLMAVYDVWGKRAVLPPATDVIQGLAWGALVFYGAGLQSGPTTSLTICLFAFVVVYIVLLNGVHGSLRDLSNDLACGLRSTAIWFGARPRAAQQLAIPLRFKLYAWAMQALSIGWLVWPLLQNVFGYGPAAWAATFVVVLFLSARCLRLLAIILAPNSSQADRARAVGAYLFASLSSVVALFALYLEPGLLIVLLIACLAPLLPKQVRHVVSALKAAPATPATKARSG
ncbi:MAG TPA: UbiA family prenyltransferase [Anaerolineae bacterium]|nr:UbiA family prenyltransferase [Anaerolineae bacterium]